jgi:hypothetical protein
VRAELVPAKELVMFQNVMVRDPWFKSACTDVVGAFVVVLYVLPMGILEAFAFMG